MTNDPRVNEHQNQKAYFHAAGLRFADYYESSVEENKENNAKLEGDLKNIFSALAIHQRENAWSKVAKLIYLLDVFLDGQGYWDELRSWVEGVRMHSSQLDNPDLLLANLLTLAHLYSIQGERKKAIEIYYEAINLAKDQKDAANLAQAYFGLGTVFSASGEFERTNRYWQKALDYASQSNDEIQRAIIKYNLTLLDKRGGKEIQSISQLNQATEYAARIFSRLGQTGTLMKSMLKASTLLQTGRDKEAQGFFLEVLEEFEKGNEEQGEALVLYNLGLIAQREGDLNSALEYYSRSLAIATNLKDRTGLILLHSSIGMAHLQTGRYDLARPFLEQCVSLLREEGDPERLADNLYWFGYALANTGDLELAEQAFEESKMIFINTDQGRVADVEKVLSKLREAIRGKE